MSFVRFVAAIVITAVVIGCASESKSSPTMTESAYVRPLTSVTQLDVNTICTDDDCVMNLGGVCSYGMEDMSIRILSLERYVIRDSYTWQNCWSEPHADHAIPNRPEVDFG